MVNGINGQDRSKSMGTGALLGMAGMSAYYLPVTKGRFVRTAFNLVKEDVEDKVELLNKAAVEITEKKLKPENKLFLSQLGIADTVDAINAKCIELTKSITDKDAVKAMKKEFDDNFKTFKKSEALMDNISSQAFSKIRWSNFGWGAVIGFVLGSVFGSFAGSNNNQLPPQL